jgi:hypothetical protein
MQAGLGQTHTDCDACDSSKKAQNTKIGSRGFGGHGK